MDIKLTLKIDGKNKTFTPPFLSGRTVKDTLVFTERMETVAITSGLLDEMVNYVVALFGNKFTDDQFYDGVEADAIYTTIGEMMNRVLGRVNKATEGLQDPNE